MRLNSAAVELSRLKILILATPKTGNTWLRSLLRFAYDLPIEELPLEWSRGCADHLPGRFVAHQHLRPDAELIRWLLENDVVVLTTIRHPGDTFLSLFHFLKWLDADPDPKSALLKLDGELPGKNSLRYVQFSFTRTYALSQSWARLGAHVVRYEDLLADPLARLRELTSRIAPVEDERLRAAVFLSRPEQLVGSGTIDPRHVRTATTGMWRKELPLDLVDAMRRIEPYASACRDYGYDWIMSAPAGAEFDYGALDPFGGRRSFDNGEPVGWALRRLYVYDVPGARERWPDPVRTAGDSFWTWLRAPSAEAASNPDFAGCTLSNLMMSVWRMRPDLQKAILDPAGADREAYVTWFLSQACHELDIPWGLIGPILEGYCSYLAEFRLPVQGIEASV